MLSLDAWHWYASLSHHEPWIHHCYWSHHWEGSSTIKPSWAIHDPSLMVDDGGSSSWIMGGLVVNLHEFFLEINVRPTSPSTRSTVMNMSPPFEEPKLSACRAIRCHWPGFSTIVIHCPLAYVDLWRNIKKQPLLMRWSIICQQQSTLTPPNQPETKLHHPSNIIQLILARHLAAEKPPGSTPEAAGSVCRACRACRGCGGAGVGGSHGSHGHALWAGTIGKSVNRFLVDTGWCFDWQFVIFASIKKWLVDQLVFSVWGCKHQPE